MGILENNSVLKDHWCDNTLISQKKYFSLQHLIDIKVWDFRTRNLQKKKAPSLLLGRQQYTIILKDKKILTNLGILMRKIWLTMQKKKSILNRIQNITIIIIIAQEKYLKTPWLRTSNNSNQWFTSLVWNFGDQNADLMNKCVTETEKKMLYSRVTRKSTNPRQKHHWLWLVIMKPWK